MSDNNLQQQAYYLTKENFDTFLDAFAGKSWKDLMAVQGNGPREPGKKKYQLRKNTLTDYIRITSGDLRINSMSKHRSELKVEGELPSHTHNVQFVLDNFSLKDVNDIDFDLQIGRLSSEGRIDSSNKKPLYPEGSYYVTVKNWGETSETSINRAMDFLKENGVSYMTDLRTAGMNALRFLEQHIQEKQKKSGLNGTAAASQKNKVDGIHLKAQAFQNNSEADYSEELKGTAAMLSNVPALKQEKHIHFLNSGTSRSEVLYFKMAYTLWRNNLQRLKVSDIISTKSEHDRATFGADVNGLLMHKFVERKLEERQHAYEIVGRPTWTDADMMSLMHRSGVFPEFNGVQTKASVQQDAAVPAHENPVAKMPVAAESKSAETVPSETGIPGKVISPMALALAAMPMAESAQLPKSKKYSHLSEDTVLKIFKKQFKSQNAFVKIRDYGFPPGSKDYQTFYSNVYAAERKGFLEGSQDSYAYRVIATYSNDPALIQEGIDRLWPEGEIALSADIAVAAEMSEPKIATDRPVEQQPVELGISETQETESAPTTEIEQPDTEVAMTAKNPSTSDRRKLAEALASLPLSKTVAKMSARDLKFVEEIIMEVYEKQTQNDGEFATAHFHYELGSKEYNTLSSRLSEYTKKGFLSRRRDGIPFKYKVVETYTQDVARIEHAMNLLWSDNVPVAENQNATTPVAPAQSTDTEVSTEPNTPKAEAPVPVTWDDLIKDSPEADVQNGLADLQESQESQEPSMDIAATDLPEPNAEDAAAPSQDTMPDTQATEEKAEEPLPQTPAMADFDIQKNDVPRVFRFAYLTENQAGPFRGIPQGQSDHMNVNHYQGRSKIEKGPDFIEYGDPVSVKTLTFSSGAKIHLEDEVPGQAYAVKVTFNQPADMQADSHFDTLKDVVLNMKPAPDSGAASLDPFEKLVFEKQQEFTKLEEQLTIMKALREPMVGFIQRTELQA